MSTKSIAKRISIYDYQRDNEVSISPKQKKDLIELIYQNIFEEEDREMYIDQINDNSMTSEEANLMALDFQMARWR